MFIKHLARYSMKMYKSCLLYLLNQRNPTPFGPSYASFYTSFYTPILHPELSVKTEGSGRGCRNVGEKHKTFFWGGERRKVGVATFESSNLLVFTKGYDLSHHAK